MLQKREPDIRVLGAQIRERPCGDTDYGDGFSSEIDCFANDGWSAVELSLPEAIAQNSDRSRGGRVLARWVE
jgi:hypothetical protein